MNLGPFVNVLHIKKNKKNLALIKSVYVKNAISITLCTGTGSFKLYELNRPKELKFGFIRRFSCEIEYSWS